MNYFSAILLCTFLTACLGSDVQRGSDNPTAISGNIRPADSQLFAAKLRWVQTADPIADAKTATAKGQVKLLAVYGYTWSIPGTKEQERFELQRKFGVQFVEGTSDALEDAEHERLTKQVVAYASAYNRYLLGQVQEK
jgi:hypothetical protein